MRVRDTFECAWAGSYGLKIYRWRFWLCKKRSSTDFSGRLLPTRCVCTKWLQELRKRRGQIKRLLPLLRFCTMLMTSSFLRETHEHKDRGHWFSAPACCRRGYYPGNFVLQLMRFLSREQTSVVPSTLEGMCVQGADRLTRLCCWHRTYLCLWRKSWSRHVRSGRNPPLNMSSEEYHCTHQHRSITFTRNSFYWQTWWMARSGKELLEKARYMHEYVNCS